MRHFQRHQRVADELQRVVASVLHDEVKDFDLRMVTVTRCDLARDLSEATVRYSVLGDETARRNCATNLAKVAGFVQRRIADLIRTHHVPHIRFEFDPAIEENIRLERLFDQIKGESQPGE